MIDRNSNKRQIWSEFSCRLVARDLRQQAVAWENRAEEIANYRGNMKPIDDPAPAMKAAIRVLTAVQNGMDPMQECKRVCRQKYLDFDQVWQLYRHKLTAWENEKRKKRNRAMRAMQSKGFKSVQIAAHFGMSKGQVSKILNAKPKPKKTRPV